MAMTKADFVAMAEAVADVRRTVTDAFEPESGSRAVSLATVDALAEQLASACARQYKGGYGFDRDRFLTACGM